MASRLDSGHIEPETCLFRAGSHRRLTNNGINNPAWGLLVLPATGLSPLGGSLPEIQVRVASRTGDAGPETSLGRWLPCLP
jgi:hypothetical protein